MDNVSNYDSKTEQIVLVAPLSQIKEDRLCFVTRKGMVKLVEGSEFEVSKRTIGATKLGEDDKVVLVQPASAMEHLVLQTREGYFLKFLKEEMLWGSGESEWEKKIWWSMLICWKTGLNV